MNNIKVLIATHKKFEAIVSEEIYVPMFVGAALNNNDIKYIKDNTGDNISAKNRNYCELTALYWLWKNDNSRIKGLCHYRRYFFNYGKRTQDTIINSEYIQKILKKHDAIIPYPYTHKGISNWDYYFKKGAGRECDLRSLRSVIENKFSEYLNDFDKIMKQEYASYFNMIITRSEIYDEYMEWLFEIFDLLEKKVCLDDYSIQEKRIYGYMSELLMNVWICHNKINIQYMCVDQVNSPADLGNSINRKYMSVYDKCRHAKYAFKHYL